MFLRLLAFMFVSNTKIKKALGNLAEPASGSFVALYIGGVKRTGASFFFWVCFDLFCSLANDRILVSIDASQKKTKKKKEFVFFSINPNKQGRPFGISESPQICMTDWRGRPGHERISPMVKFCTFLLPAKNPAFLLVVALLFSPLPLIK